MLFTTPDGLPRYILISASTTAKIEYFPAPNRPALVAIVRIGSKSSSRAPHPLPHQYGLAKSGKGIAKNGQLGDYTSSPYPSIATSNWRR